MTKPGGADHQFKQLIDRILRCRQAEDDAKADTKDVYAELKSLGYDKTGAGELVAELRKKDKDAAGFEERSAILDLYREAYERASGTVVATHTHTRENARQPVEALSEVALPTTDDDTGLSGLGRASGTGSAGREGSTPSAAPASSGEGRRAAESPRFESVHGAREAHRPATYGQLVTAGETAPVSAMTAKTKADVMRLLRPFCQHLEDSEKCGGHGSKHCHTCQLLADTARATA